MGFFFNETRQDGVVKKTTAPKREIPIASLREMGCKVCPRDKYKLHTPKMEASGADYPYIYLLGTAPSIDEDEDGRYWTDKAGDAIKRKMPRDFFQDSVRSNHITQCEASADKSGQDAVVATECCRNRIIDDIEKTQPLLVIGIGDAPLKWAMSFTKGNALTWRGTMMVAKFGKHVCWFMPLLYPNYVFKKSSYKSEYELALEHDIKAALDFVRGEDQTCKVYEAPYDAGIEYITGQEPGDMQRLEAALNRMRGYKEVGIDVETNGLNVHMNKDPSIWTMAIGTFEDSVVFALDHPEGWGTTGRRAQVERLVLDFLIDSGHKVAHNLAHELSWLGHRFGWKLLRLTSWEDTMCMAHTLDERPGTKALDAQIRIHFGFGLKEQSRVDPVRLLEYPIKEALRYNALDTKWTSLLARKLRPLINKEPAYKRQYERKIRTAATLVLTEAKGLPVDFAYAEAQKDKLEGEVKEIERRLRKCNEIKQYEQRFGTFSPTNSDHVLKLMKDICHRDEIRVENRDGAIQWTTGEEVLAAMPRDEVPSAPLILEHRAIAKLLSTYVMPVITRKIVCPDGRIHNKYSQLHAVTTRLASDDPNVQNWPKRKHKEVRGIIYAG